MSKPGKLDERYNFFLNPYSDCAFSTCPKCGRKTKLKKLPLTIIIKKGECVLNLNKTCRFCENCDLLIARKKEVEELLRTGIGRLSDKDYFIIGTIDKSTYADAALLEGDDFFDRIHVFKNQWNFELEPRGWVRD